MTDGGGDRHPHEAHFRPGRWPGLVWAVPIGALLVVAWIGIRAFVHNGPEVHVAFPLVGGIKTQHTKVKYRGAVVGHVSEVRIYPIRDQMKVDIRFNSDMEGYLARDTKFWIVGNSFQATSLSSLKTVITGPYIDIDPVKGKTWHKFVGAAKPPILKHRHQGETFVLLTRHLGNIARGSKVYYRHMKVGAVLGYRLPKRRGRFHVYIFVRAPYQQLVQTTTKFWDASALHVALGGSGPGIELQSLPALISGAVAFMTPAQGHGVRSGTRFTLYKSQGDARDAPSPIAVRYQLTLSGGPHGLKRWAPVTLEGARVGSVTAVHMVYDGRRGRLMTHVRVALDPRLLGLTSARRAHAPLRGQVDAMLRTLIAHGLRAERARSTPLIGAPGIVLSRVPGAKPATLEAGHPPTIPAVAAGSITDITRQVSAILVKVRALPLSAIAGNIRTATSHIAALSRSQKTKKALEDLDKTLANIHAISKSAHHDLPTILKRVRKAAHAAQKAVAGLQGIMGEGLANPGPDTSSLPAALRQVSEAARSLRTLADYLDEHPNALIVGKGG